MTRSVLLLAAFAAVTLACGSAPRAVYAPTQIAWTQAEALLLEGEVDEVVRTAEGFVRLELRDGRRVVTREPVDGEIERVIARCGEPCAGVVVRR
ncbi:MAG: hypothetical protein ACRD2J_07365 [Thermoanaerobaculia bacterium]